MSNEHYYMSIDKERGERMNAELNEKKKDADALIKEVLNKIPEERKLEALRIVEGFALCANADQKAG